MLRRLTLITALAVAVAVPGSASAATVTLEVTGAPSVPEATLTYTAADGETNDVTITSEAGANEFLVTENSATALTAGNGCVAQSTRTLRCSTTAPDVTAEVSVELLDFDDALDLSGLDGLHPTQVDAGDGDDRITGSAGTDFIQGGAGADEIDGGEDDDDIDGGTGKDDLAGGPGADIVHGSRRADSAVSCGSGADRQEPARGARHSNDCETILGADGDLEITARATKLKGRKASYRFRCLASRCRPTVVLFIGKREVGRSRRVSVPGGRTLTIGVTLRRALKKKTEVRVRVTGSLKSDHKARLGR